MKYAIDDHTNIKAIPKDTNEVHLIRPIKKEKFEELLKLSIERITLSESCFDRLPKKTKAQIKAADIELVTQKRRGRALDITLEEMLEIIALRKDYQSLREIERLTKVPKSTIHYLLKYASRSKIKKGNNIIYLK